jgi:hypothetical protein
MNEAAWTIFSCVVTSWSLPRVFGSYGIITGFTILHILVGIHTK